MKLHPPPSARGTKVKLNSIANNAKFLNLLHFSDFHTKVRSVKILGFANIGQCSAVDARFYASFMSLLDPDQRCFFRLKIAVELSV